MVLAALGIGFGAVLGGVLAGDWAPSTLTSWGEPIWWLGAGAALASVIAAALAVWPRLGAGGADRVHYWGDVAKFATLEELASSLDEHPIDSGGRTRQQMWELSRIVNRKYALVRAAIVLAGCAVLMMLIAAGSEI